MIFFLGNGYFHGLCFLFGEGKFPHMFYWVVTDEGRWICHFCLFNVFHLCGRLDFDIPGV